MLRSMLREVPTSDAANLNGAEVVTVLAGRLPHQVHGLTGPKRPVALGLNRREVRPAAARSAGAFDDAPALLFVPGEDRATVLAFGPFDGSARDQ
jgi:hypothetical protein